MTPFFSKTTVDLQYYTVLQSCTMKNKTVTIRLTEINEKRLAELLEKTELDQTTVLTQALKEYHERVCGMKPELIRKEPKKDDAISKALANGALTFASDIEENS